MLKIGLSYTGGGPGLMTIVENAIRSVLPDETPQFVTMANPVLIEDTLAAGSVTPAVARGLIRGYQSLVDAGVDLIVSVCSTMGDVAEAAKPSMAAMSMPFIRVDEEMVRHALTTYGKVAVIYASKPVMGPNRNLVEKVASDTGSRASVNHLLLEGGGGGQGSFVERIVSLIRAQKEKPDVVMLTQ